MINEFANHRHLREISKSIFSSDFLTKLNYYLSESASFAEE